MSGGLLAGCLAYLLPALVPPLPQEPYRIHHHQQHQRQHAPVEGAYVPAEHAVLQDVAPALEACLPAEQAVQLVPAVE